VGAIMENFKVIVHEYIGKPTLKIGFFVVLLILIQATAVEAVNQSTESQDDVGVPNPAALYCISLGYTLEDGFCVFPDGSKCEEWSFYRGKCGQQFTFCEQNGFTIVNRTDDMGTWTAEYAVCIFDDGSECMEQDYFDHKCNASECSKWILSKGGCVPAINEIRFTGTAIAYNEGDMPGAPTCWTVEIDKIISGPRPCSNKIDVCIAAVAPPVGYMDPSITIGSKVEAYGDYIENQDKCSVTLAGSVGYYIKKMTPVPALTSIGILLLSTIVGVFGVLTIKRKD
jgi:putative hemolysin